MPFVTIIGLPGKVYVPEPVAGTARKHNCPDCFSCRMCVDIRCHVCRCEKRPASTRPAADHENGVIFQNQS